MEPRVILHGHYVLTDGVHCEKRDCGISHVDWHGVTCMCVAREAKTRLSEEKTDGCGTDDRATAVGRACSMLSCCRARARAFGPGDLSAEGEA